MSRFATAAVLFGALTLFGISAASAQSRRVTGTVTEAETRDPLPGINIVVLGTTTGTVTDIDGRFALDVPGPDAVLVFSSIGYTSQNVVVGTRTVIDVRMAEGTAALDELVVVGYGTQRRGDVTSSVSVVNVSEANIGSITSPDDLIEGRVAGVQIIENNGEPGGGVTVRIRGGTSITASNEPLYVIDGVPIDNGSVSAAGLGVSGASAAPSRNPLTLINPNDILTMTVLKDASATAIYGSRGANGVVLITTKTGVQGVVSVDYETRVSSATAANRLDLISAGGYRSFIEEQVAARRLGYNPQGVLVDENKNGKADVIDALGTANTDFQDAVLRTGIAQQHNLSFSSGTATSQLRASVNYLNQEGVVISSGIERLTARLNANNQIFNGRVRLGLNLTSAVTNNDYVAYENTAGFEGGLFTNVYDYNPTLPIYDETSQDGFFEIAGQRSIRNPVALAEQIEDDDRTIRSLGNFSLDVDLFRGLTAQVNLGGDRSVSRRSIFFPRASPIGEEFSGRVIQRDFERNSVTLQSYLTYRKTSEKAHNFDVLGGYEFNEFQNSGFSAETRNFITDITGVDALQAGTPNISGIGSGREMSRLISFFTRGNYNYAGRYFFSSSLRYDGSSRFGPDNRWALFPAVSGAWRVSDESFLRGNKTISDLRLRAGYGVVGNQGIGNRLSLALLGPDAGSNAILGGQVFSGYAPIQLENPGLRWEQKQETTIGLDYGLFGGRVFGALEFYRNTTKDLLLEISLPQPAPVPFFVDNAGSLRNTGIDFNLDAFLYDKGETNFSLGFVFNTNKNEVLSLGGRDRLFTGSVSGRGQSGQNALLVTPGQPFPVFYAFEFLRVNEQGRQVFNNYKDTDGDGIGDQLDGETLAPTDDDRRIVGDPLPDFSYGFRTKFGFKGVGLSLFFRGEQGRQLFNNRALIFQTKSAAAQGRGFFAEALNDPDAFDEAPRFSDRWIEDASFIKLDNITLDYGLNRLLNARRVRNARVFLSVDNAFTITPYSGYDPEVNTNAQVGRIAALGIDYTNYPVPRTITLGFNLGF